MSFGTQLRDAADRLIEAAGNGTPFTVTRSSPGAYDPATGTQAPSVSTTSVMGVLLNYADKDIDGTRVQAEDRKAFVRGNSSIVIDVGDMLTTDDGDFSVVHARRRRLTDTEVAYTLQVRG